MKAILLKPLFSLKLELKEELIFSEAYLDAVVKKALTLNTGATSLDEIVEESTEMAQWEILIHPKKYKYLFLDERCVWSNLDCYLEDQEGNKISLREENDSEMSMKRKLNSKK